MEINKKLYLQRQCPTCKYYRYFDGTIGNCCWYLLDTGQKKKTREGECHSYEYSDTHSIRKNFTIVGGNDASKNI